MTRLYDATKGQVLINGKDIKEYQLNSLRNQIGYVAQKAHLFKGSIKENISFGKPDATMDEIEEAAKLRRQKSLLKFVIINTKMKSAKMEPMCLEGKNNVYRLHEPLSWIHLYISMMTPLVL